MRSASSVCRKDIYARLAFRCFNGSHNRPELFQRVFCGGSADRTCKDALPTPSDKLGNYEMVRTHLGTTMYVRGTALT